MKGVHLYIGCLYMPTQGNIKQKCTNSFNFLKEDIYRFKSKGRVLLLEDFNVRVGKRSDVGNIVVMFGEDTCNSNSNLLTELIHNCDMMICNGTMVEHYHVILSRLKSKVIQVINQLLNI